MESCLSWCGGPPPLAGSLTMHAEFGKFNKVWSFALGKNVVIVDDNAQHTYTKATETIPPSSVARAVVH